MSKRKVKVEMSDENENKITITYEGIINEKSLNDLITSANSILGKNAQEMEKKEDVPIENALDLPVIDRVQLVIGTAFGMGSWFTTNDLCESYYDIFQSNLKITTASTYLARLHKNGLLERSGSRNERKFQLKRELREKMPKLITQ
ncbi:MAG: hypothetical protein U9O98_10695 [Asgard group archaeon]|nr:hypothetical protein [Asgard group archaeon]